MTLRLNSEVAAVISVCMLAVGLAAPAAAQTPLDSALDVLRSNAGGSITYQTSSPDSYTLLRAPGSAPLLADNASAAPEARAMAFLSAFRSVIGAADPASQLQLQRITQDRAGNTHVHLEQVHAGLPVFGARVIVHMNDTGIYGVNGVFVPEAAGTAIVPQIDDASMSAAAVRAVQKSYPTAVLSVESSRLMVYRAGLLDIHDGRTYLAREITVRNAAGSIREHVYMDANGGGVINRISGIHTAKNREIYSPDQNTPPVLTEGAINAPADPPLTGDTPADPATRAPRPPQDNLYIFAGGTFDLYDNLFSYPGYDFGTTPDMDQVQKSVYLITDACPNAFWNGDSTNYCPGFDTDDIVSHEWSHAYTAFSHNLIYQYQSGALNEGYSDIFGETYDLVNGLEGPAGASRPEDAYWEDGGSRWVLGEDLSETAAAALLRDMWDPDSFGAPRVSNPSPGSVITSPNYFCGSGDGGGVHTNSGVPNHAYAMLVDGKSFNGVDIPQIGMTRAAHIYFHAATNYQGPTTNFIQHADALGQSCQDLLGVPLNDVLGAVSPDTITLGTCAALEAAMLAVEMRQSPRQKCNYQPLLVPEPETPAFCGDGETEVVDFSEDWEGSASVPAGWVVSENITGDTSEGVAWSVISNPPSPHEGNAVFFPNTFGGTCTPGGDISGSFLLASPEITVTDADSHFRFAHLMQSEFGFDGGNLKVSVNGGAYGLVPALAFDFNSYNDAFEPGGPGGNTNPLAGETAWTGSDEGESFSNWGVSIVDLPSLGANPGDTVSFRFEFGQDGCNGNLGWYVDEVAVAHCAAGGPVDPPQEPEDPPTEPPAETPVTPSASADLFRAGSLGSLLLPILAASALRRRRAASRRSASRC